VKKLVSIQANASDKAAKAYRTQSRARISELAAKGQGRQALAESLSLLGIDINSGVKPRIVGCNGVSFRA